MLNFYRISSFERKLILSIVFRFHRYLYAAGEGGTRKWKDITLSGNCIFPSVRIPNPGIHYFGRRMSLLNRSVIIAFILDFLPPLRQKKI